MQKIRVLVVDDAVVVRRMVTDILNGDPQIEVISTAPNGKIALAKITQVQPDIITMDVEMPEMDGLETLKELRKSHPKLPVIMFSTLTERGAQAALEALSLGANDYVTKPANIGSVPQAIKRIQEELIPKIKALCSHLAPSKVLVPTQPSKDGAVRAVRQKTIPPRIAQRAQAPKQIEVVCIGVSTGGPNALATLLPMLPGSFPVPIVLVQHMPPLFTKLLAERLQSKCQLKVRECVPCTPIQPGEVWIAPGGSHMVVERKGTQVLLQTNQLPPENSCRPAVDVLFRSVAKVYGGASLAVILTGMGQDGTRGCEVLRELGAQVLAQDEASSVVWGMPGFVTQAGLADKVLPLNQMAGEIISRVRRESPVRVAV